MNTVRDLSLVGYSDHCLEEFNEDHVDMSILLNLIDLRHHGQIVHIANLFASKIVTQTVGC